MPTTSYKNIENNLILKKIIKKEKMIEAFIFITTKPNKIDSVGNAVKKIEGVKNVYVVTGEIDIITEVEVKDFSELARIVKEKILNIDGVSKTSTSLITEKY